jgi:hypothetical protein
VRLLVYDTAEDAPNFSESDSLARSITIPFLRAPLRTAPSTATVTSPTWFGAPVRAIANPVP